MRTGQWSQKAQIMAVNSVASELRTHGYLITCEFEGRSPTGSSVFRYRLQQVAP